MCAKGVLFRGSNISSSNNVALSDNAPSVAASVDVKDSMTEGASVRRYVITGECAQVLGAIGVTDELLITGELKMTDCVDKELGELIGEGLPLRLRIRRAVVMKWVKKRASVKTGVDDDIKIQLLQNAKQRVNGNDEGDWCVTQG